MSESHDEFLSHTRDVELILLGEEAEKDVVHAEVNRRKEEMRINHEILVSSIVIRFHLDATLPCGNLRICSMLIIPFVQLNTPHRLLFTSSKLPSHI